MDVLKLKILVCDDDPVDRKLMQAYLSKIEDIESEVLEAGSVEEIRDFLSVEDIDLILMDVQMPQKSGMDWLEEIVDRDVAPVIIISGYGSEETVVEAINKGAYDYISKAWLSPESLKRGIYRVLEKSMKQQQIKKLFGFLNICPNCRRIQDENGVWKPLEEYIDEHSQVVTLSRLCPICAKNIAK
ncbi:response regulator [bacterium]|nr:response regulator [bacterium]